MKKVESIEKEIKLRKKRSLKLKEKKLRGEWRISKKIGELIKKKVM